MAQYMAVCEAVITKPGGLSSTEAAVSNSRLIHISPIPGCESKNARFFSKNGCSIYVRSVNKELLPAIKRLQDDTFYTAMRENQNHCINKYAARDICQLLEREL